MRILYQFNMKVTDLDRVAMPLELAAASVRAGHEVAIFLAGDAVTLVVPKLIPGVNEIYGLTGPRVSVQWLLGQGVRFYVSKQCADYRKLHKQLEKQGPPNPQVVYATFDQLAVELANFDRILVY